LLWIGVEHPEFVSRKANAFGRSANLALFIDRELDAHTVFDGEVVCFDSAGRPRFYELMLGRGDPAFVVFDILALEGRDLRGLAMIERKKILRRFTPRRSSFVLFADFIEARGCDFYRSFADEISKGWWRSGKLRRTTAISRRPRGLRSRVRSIARRATGQSCSCDSARPTRSA
jgi:ATP-dependent DNA ligase